MSEKLPRLVLSEVIDLPVVEASGVTVRRTERGAVILVVGDRTAEVGVCVIGADGALDDWETIDLAELPGWPLPPGDSQFEAIAADGGSVVAVMSEDPPLVLVADTVTREFRAEIRLTAPAGSVLDGQWDDASSRGEGLVFLRGGRLLVAQEKRPRALIEFGPVGTRPQGLSSEDLLAPGESWEAPTGQVDFVPLSMWELKSAAKKALGDVSRSGRTSTEICGCSATSRSESDGSGWTCRSTPTTTWCATSTRSGSFPTVPSSPRALRRSVTAACWWPSTLDRPRATA